MIRRPQLSAVIAIAALSLGSANVFAQSGATARLYCHAVGASTPEPLGDREGHAIAVSEITGRVEGGATDGGVLTGGLCAVGTAQAPAGSSW